MLSSGKILMQKCISQHYIINDIYPNSINTIRLITINNDDRIEFLCAILRIGANGHKVDNWSQGGISVRVDINTGNLNKWGFYKPGYAKTRTYIHPDTGIVFKDIKVPYWSEVLNLAEKLHSNMKGIYSIEWDIAIVEEGPIFIEGNDNWEISHAQVCCGGLKNEFIKTIKL